MSPQKHFLLALLSYIFCLISVPTGNPQDFIAVPVNSTSIQLTWHDLQPEERNGIIRIYRISITELETGSVLNITTDKATTQQIVNSLHPFYNYCCTVAAFTVGLGPSAITDVQTLPEGINPIEN